MIFALIERLYEAPTHELVKAGAKAASGPGLDVFERGN